MDPLLLDDYFNDELEAVHSQGTLALVQDSAFIEQRKFIDDPARHKALHCTRRAAKSFTAGLYMVETCLK